MLKLCQSPTVAIELWIAGPGLLREKVEDHHGRTPANPLSRLSQTANLVSAVRKFHS